MKGRLLLFIKFRRREFIYKYNINDNLQQSLSLKFKQLFLSENNDGEILTLKTIANLYQPKTISGDELVKKGKYFVYGANGIIGKYNEYNHKENQIAIACRGASCGVVTMTLPYSWITGNAMVVEPSEKFPYKEFIYQMLVTKNVSYLNTGSAQPQLTRENLQNYSFKIKNKDYIKYFENDAKVIRDKLISIEIENNQLISLRDWLLPMLMNGQVTLA